MINEKQLDKWEEHWRQIYKEEWGEEPIEIIRLARIGLLQEQIIKERAKKKALCEEMVAVKMMPAPQTLEELFGPPPSKWLAKGIYEAGLRRVSKTPQPKGQKYPIGTIVKIADNLGPAKKDFKANRYARVQYTYAHAYGGDNVWDYSLLVRYEPNKWSSVAWYDESDFSEVKEPDIIKELTQEIDKSLSEEQINSVDQGPDSTIK